MDVALKGNFIADTNQLGVDAEIIDELARLADEARHGGNQERGTQLDFSEGCLIDLRSSLCVAICSTAGTLLASRISMV